VDRPATAVRFEEATGVIDAFYADGGRCLYHKGGEPFLWYDDSHSMEDIVLYARQKGYYAVIIYTNATKKLESSADTLFESVDGPADIYDHLRGKSFDRIITNIATSDHPSIYISKIWGASKNDPWPGKVVL